MHIYMYLCIYICRHTPAMHHSYASIMPHLSMRHGAHLNESWHNLNESWHTYERVHSYASIMAHNKVSHGTYMYIYMYVCMYTCECVHQYNYVHTNGYKKKIQLYLCTCKYEMYIKKQIYSCICIHENVCLYMYMYKHIYIYMHQCTYIYIHIYIYILFKYIQM